MIVPRIRELGAFPVIGSLGTARTHENCGDPDPERQNGVRLTPDLSVKAHNFLCGPPEYSNLLRFFFPRASKSWHLGPPPKIPFLVRSGIYVPPSFRRSYFTLLSSRQGCDLINLRIPCRSGLRLGSGTCWRSPSCGTTWTHKPRLSLRLAPCNDASFCWTGHLLTALDAK